MKPSFPRNTLAALIAGALTAAVGSVGAADISWSTGPAFGGANGHQAILTNGTLVEAVDIDTSGGSVVVDPTGLNITFTKLDPSFLGGYIFDAVDAAGSTDAGWNSVVRSADWNAGSDITVPSFLSGLTPGAGYQLQLFAADTRGCCGSRQSRFGDGNGNFSAFVVQNSLTSVVGTFVADGGTQALDFDTSSNAPILNAYVLRQVSAVPEPASVALLLAGLGVVAWRLRSRA
jgi:hypothetical protein